MSSYLIKPELSSAYPVVSYAKGSYVYDQTGKKYLDGSSGAVTCNIGQGVRDVTEKLKEQLDQVSFVSMEQLPRNNFGSAFIVWFL